MKTNKRRKITSTKPSASSRRDDGTSSLPVASSRVTAPATSSDDTIDSRILNNRGVQAILGLDFNIGLASSVLLSVMAVAVDQVKQVSTLDLEEILKSDADLVKRMETVWTTRTFRDVLSLREYPSQSTNSLHSNFPSSNVSKGITRASQG
jgi:hypothetical protein